MGKEKKNRFTRKDYDTMVATINESIALNEGNYTQEQYLKFLKAYITQVKGETPTIAEISQIINIMNL